MYKYGALAQPLQKSQRTVITLSGYEDDDGINIPDEQMAPVYEYLRAQGIPTQTGLSISGAKADGNQLTLSGTYVYNDEEQEWSLGGINWYPGQFFQSSTGKFVESSPLLKTARTVGIVALFGALAFGLGYGGLTLYKYATR